MKAPKSVILATLPVTTFPTANFSSAPTHGFSSSNLIERAILEPLISLINTLTFCSGVKIFLGFSTCPQLISEMWRSPSAPPRSMNTPKSVTFLTVPSTTSPTLMLSNNFSASSVFLATRSCFLSPMIRLLLGDGVYSIITNSTSCPKYFVRSFSNVSDTSDAGINTRLPSTETDKPPAKILTTGPERTVLFSKASLIFSLPLSIATLLCERRTSPSPSLI